MCAPSLESWNIRHLRQPWTARYGVAVFATTQLMFEAPLASSALMRARMCCR